MAVKRKNPYQVLLEEFKRFIGKVKYPKKAEMFFIRKGNLNAVYTLDDVYHKVVAAQSLGYKVVLEAKPDGLKCMYEMKAEIPWRYDD